MDENGFFLPMYLIEAFGTPKKYQLVYVKQLDEHLFNLNFIFLSNGFPAMCNEEQVLQQYSASSRPHSVAMDGHRVIKFACGVEWTFACKMCQIEKSGNFKPGNYGGQSAGVQNSANNCWAVLAVWSGAKSAERRIFHQDTSS